MTRKILWEAREKEMGWGLMRIFLLPPSLASWYA